MRDDLPIATFTALAVEAVAVLLFLAGAAVWAAIFSHPGVFQ